MYTIMYMVIKEHMPLAPLSTMRLGGNARYLCEVKTEEDVEEAAAFAKKNKLKIHVLGGGSNTIFTDGGFEGLVIVNRIEKFIHEVEGGMLTLLIGAGEDWDDIVAQTVKLGYGDIAALSLIGTNAHDDTNAVMQGVVTDVGDGIAPGP